MIFSAHLAPGSWLFPPGNCCDFFTITSTSTSQGLELATPKRHSQPIHLEGEFGPCANAWKSPFLPAIEKSVTATANAFSHPWISRLRRSGSTCHHLPCSSVPSHTPGRDFKISPCDLRGIILPNLSISDSQTSQACPIGVFYRIRRDERPPSPRSCASIEELTSTALLNTVCLRTNI